MRGPRTFAPPSAASAAKEAIEHRGVVGGMDGPSYSSFSSREEASDNAEEEEDVKAARFVGENDGPKALALWLINATMIMDVPAENLVLAMLAQE